MTRFAPFFIARLALVAAAVAVVGCGTAKSTTPTTSVQIVRDSITPAPAKGQLTTPTQHADLSANAQFVAYVSSDPALPGQDGSPHIYLYDRSTATVTKVSTKVAAQDRPRVSTDGRFVAFTAATSPPSVWRTDLAASFGTGDLQIDVPVASSTAGESHLADMTPDGTFVLFFSATQNLDTGAQLVSGVHQADSTSNVDLFRWTAGVPVGLRPVVRCNSIPDDVSGSQMESAQPVDTAAAAISDDGRYVAFSTTSPDLIVPGPTAGHQVYRRDVLSLVNGQPSLIVASSLVGSAITYGNGDSTQPDISGDGHTVVFASAATNLVPSLTAPISGTNILALLHLDSGSTVITPVSWNVVAAPATLAGGAASQPRISQDGSTVAFASAVALTTPAGASSDVYWRSLANATTQRVSIGVAAAAANGASTEPAISADGLNVEFASSANNVISDTTVSDTNAVSDIFVALVPPTSSG